MTQNSTWKHRIIRYGSNLIPLLLSLVLIEISLHVIGGIGSNNTLVKTIQNSMTYKSGKQADDEFWKLRFLRQYEAYGQAIAGGGRAQLKPDAQLGWVPRKNLHLTDKTGDTYTTNSMGFRALREYDKISHEKYVVLLVGDSFTYGADADDSEIWPAILQEQAPELEIINLGVAGYGTDQMLLMLQKYIAFFQPDLVIAAIYEEDVFRSLLSFRSFQKPKLEWKKGALHVTNVPIGSLEDVYATIRHEMRFKRFISQIRLLTLLQNTLYQFQVFLQKQPVTLRKYGPLSDEYIALNEKILHNMLASSSQAQAEFLCVYVPAGHELIDPDFSSTVGDVLAAICSREHITYYNPRQEFLKIPAVFLLNKMSMQRLRATKVPDKIIRALKPLKHTQYTEDAFWDAVVKQIGEQDRQKYNSQILAAIEPQYRMGHYGKKEATIFATAVYQKTTTLSSYRQVNTSSK